MELLVIIVLIILLIFHILETRKLRKEVEKYSNALIKKETVFKISGADLVGVLSKYNKKESEV